MVQPKPVRDVRTSDGRLHEVDLRHASKSYTAWAFVDRRLIEGSAATTQPRAIANWKKEYEATFSAT
jgi:hypothetical protein